MPNKTNENLWRTTVGFPKECVGEDITTNSFDIVWVRVHNFGFLEDQPVFTHVKAMAYTFLRWLGTIPIHAYTISFNIHLFEATISN